jgi:hypothetical protein
MRAKYRVLITATMLAALGTLGLAYSAHAVPPPSGGGNLHQQQRAPRDRHAKVWRCNAGHGPQVDCAETGSLTHSPTALSPAVSIPVGSGRLNIVRSVALLGLLAILVTVGAWLRRHHRPREAI